MINQLSAIDEAEEKMYALQLLFAKTFGLSTICHVTILQVKFKKK